MLPLVQCRPAPDAVDRRVGIGEFQAFPAYGSAGADNSYTNSGLAQMAWGYETGAVFRYSRTMGGLAGSHAEYVRVPFADYGAFTVPGGVDDTSAAVFTSDAAPTGWMGADLGGVQPGDVVAVWGAGGVGQMAARASVLLGAEKVMVIDRIPVRAVFRPQPDHRLAS